MTTARPDPMSTVAAAVAVGTATLTAFGVTSFRAGCSFAGIVTFDFYTVEDDLTVRSNARQIYEHSLAMGHPLYAYADRRSNHIVHLTNREPNPVITGIHEEVLYP